MEIIIVPTADEIGVTGAQMVAAVIAGKPTAVVGLATGSSPQGIYRRLAEKVADKEISFRHATGFALDEYVGLPSNHPEAYANVLLRDVVRPLGFRPDRVHVPDGRNCDLDAAGARYERAIAEAGGVDLQILGIGANGHIGFNEPGSPLDSRTRVTELAAQTRDDNKRFFESIEEVPDLALTQGLATIVEARELLLVAAGPSKAAAVAAALEGPVSAELPASVLQLHPRATFVIDELAASRLRHPYRVRRSLDLPSVTTARARRSSNAAHIEGVTS